MSSIRLYSYHTPSSVKLLINSDIKRQIEAVRCGLHHYDMTVADDHVVTNDRFYIEFTFDTANAEWIHIGEVSFSDGELSNTVTTASTSSDRDKEPPTTTPTTTRMASTSTPVDSDTTLSTSHTYSENDQTPVATPTSVTRSETTSTNNPMTLPQDNSGPNTIIMVSAIGSAMFGLLLIVTALVLACIVFRRVKRSRQTCSNEENTQQSLKRGYSIDKQIEWEYCPEGAVTDLGMEQNAAYVCTNGERDSAHIYQEIPQGSGFETLHRKGGLRMVRNEAYSTVPNKQVILCTDNVAYTCNDQASVY